MRSGRHGQGSQQPQDARRDPSPGVFPFCSPESVASVILQDGHCTPSFTSASQSQGHKATASLHGGVNPTPGIYILFSRVDLMAFPVCKESGKMNFFSQTCFPIHGNGEGGGNGYLGSTWQCLLCKNHKNLLNHPTVPLRSTLMQALPPASTFEGLLCFSISRDRQRVSTVPAVTPGSLS